MRFISARSALGRGSGGGLALPQESIGDFLFIWEGVQSVWVCSSHHNHVGDAPRAAVVHRDVGDFVHVDVLAELGVHLGAGCLHGVAHATHEALEVVSLLSTLFEQGCVLAVDAQDGPPQGGHEGVVAAVVAQAREIAQLAGAAAPHLAVARVELVAPVVPGWCCADRPLGRSEARLPRHRRASAAWDGLRGARQQRHGGVVLRAQILCQRVFLSYAMWMRVMGW